MGPDHILLWFWLLIVGSVVIAVPIMKNVNIHEEEKVLKQFPRSSTHGFKNLMRLPHNLGRTNYDLFEYGANHRKSKVIEFSQKTDDSSLQWQSLPRMKQMDSVQDSWKYNCPCEERWLCKPIEVTKRKNEVFIFSVTNDSAHWDYYDWSRITTVVMFGYHNPKLVCLAHKHKARIVLKVDFPVANLTNPKDCQNWVTHIVGTVKDRHLDGVNFDIEGPVNATDYSRINALTALVNQTTVALKRVNKNYQVTFDAAWRPDCVDNRCYEMFALSQVVDYLFVMAYDQQSQMRTKHCQARPNSGFNQTVTGVLEYIQKNIPKKKLILGVPWYGYDYECLSLSKTYVCSIKAVPFRGASCSDAAARQMSYKTIMEMLVNKSLIRRWDNATSSPYYNYKDTRTSTPHQVWYDDVQSLALKYNFAVQVGLAGVGMWNADTLDYTSSGSGTKLRKAMWNALPKYNTTDADALQLHSA